MTTGKARGESRHSLDWRESTGSNCGNQQPISSHFRARSPFPGFSEPRCATPRVQEEWSGISVSGGSFCSPCRSRCSRSSWSAARELLPLQLHQLERLQPRLRLRRARQLPEDLHRQAVPSGRDQHRLLDDRGDPAATALGLGLALLIDSSVPAPPRSSPSSISRSACRRSWSGRSGCGSTSRTGGCSTPSWGR